MNNQSYITRANRGKPRIWIQGKRLTAAGFIPGSHYIVNRWPDQIILTTIPAGQAGPEGAEVRKVTGRPNSTPIIDLSGKGCAPFITGDPVTITYLHHTITIEATS